MPLRERDRIWPWKPALAASLGLGVSGDENGIHGDPMSRTGVCPARGNQVGSGGGFPRARVMAARKASGTRTEAARSRPLSLWLVGELANMI